MNIRTVLPLLLLALITTACALPIYLFDNEVETGSTEIEEISVPSLQTPSETAYLTLSFGAGKLNIETDSDEALLSGTATFNVSDFRPEISIEGNEIRVEQGNLDLEGIPSFSDDYINDWHLAIGNSPVELKVNAGAYAGNFELGGLSIKRLEINDGASDVQVAFSRPNLVEMSLFKYSTGASRIKLEGLANTNADQFIFRSGAGAYTLDFKGNLTRDMSVTIESGISQITIIMPIHTAAVLTTNGLLTVSASGDWVQADNIYTITGSGPTITIDVDMGAGNLVLETR